MQRIYAIAEIVDLVLFCGALALRARWTNCVFDQPALDLLPEFDQTLVLGATPPQEIGHPRRWSFPSRRSPKTTPTTDLRHCGVQVIRALDSLRQSGFNRLSCLRGRAVARPR